MRLELIFYERRNGESFEFFNAIFALSSDHDFGEGKCPFPSPQNRRSKYSTNGGAQIVLSLKLGEGNEEKKEELCEELNSLITP